MTRRECITWDELQRHIAEDRQRIDVLVIEIVPHVEDLTRGLNRVQQILEQLPPEGPECREDALMASYDRELERQYLEEAQAAEPAQISEDWGWTDEYTPVLHLEENEYFHVRGDEGNEGMGSPA